MARRRRVLHGPDPFANLIVPRGAEIARLRQTLLNLELRLRAAFIVRGLREEQLALAVAEAAGPLRSCAAALAELRGERVGSPKEALEREASTAGPGAAAALADMSEAREKRLLPPGRAAQALIELLGLAATMRARAGELRP